MARHQIHRSDANQPLIVEGLRWAGIEVHVIDRPVDLLCGWQGKWVLLEVKDEKGQLTPAQVDFFENPKGPAFVVRSVEAAINSVKNGQLPLV